MSDSNQNDIGAAEATNRDEALDAPEQTEGLAGADAQSADADPESPEPDPAETIGAAGEAEQGAGSLEADFETLNDRHLRLVAEFTNYRRRVESEMAGTWVRAQADLVRHLLEAFDDLQRVGTWEAETSTVEALVEGVDLVERKFRQALETAGVKAVDPTGEAFDPNTMEAMMRLSTESEEDDDIVAEVFQKGYLFKDILVRPARVSVFKRD